ncbi:MAG TPA: hypothetical protein VF662_11235 [Allosphingosinicella sp.]|jgi:hypothetical protein
MGWLLEIIQLPLRRKQRSALKSRYDVTKDSFVRSMADDPLDEAVASFIWDFLVDAAVVIDFKPLPDDNFLRMYGLAEEDLDDDLILRTFENLQLPPPSSSTIEQVGEIKCPQDIMRLVRLSRSQ